jgi:hypothetical protein
MSESLETALTWSIVVKGIREGPASRALFRAEAVVLVHGGRFGEEGAYRLAECIRYSIYLMIVATSKHSAHSRMTCFSSTLARGGVLLDLLQLPDGFIVPNIST